MRPVGLPVEGKPLAGRRNLDYLGVEVEAGGTAELGLVVALRYLEIAAFGEWLDACALRLDAPIGYAGR